MNKFGFSDSVLDSVRSVLRGEKPEENLDEAMEMHVKMEPGGTHYKVHKVGKKLAAHGGIRVGEKLSDTEMDDAREMGVRVRHMKEEDESAIEEGAMKRMATQSEMGYGGTGLDTFKKMSAKKNGNGMNGLTTAQKKLPKALQAAILKKKKKK